MRALNKRITTFLDTVPEVYTEEFGCEVSCFEDIEQALTTTADLGIKENILSLLGIQVDYKFNQFLIFVVKPVCNFLRSSLRSDPVFYTVLTSFYII